MCNKQTWIIIHQILFSFAITAGIGMVGYMLWTYSNHYMYEWGSYIVMGMSHSQYIFGINQTHSDSCPFKFSVFNFSKIQSSVFQDEYTFNDPIMCGQYLFDELYKHKCYISDSEQASIVISSFAWHEMRFLNKINNISTECIEPGNFTNKQWKPRPIFESYFMLNWIKYMNKQCDKSNEKYLLFFTISECRGYPESSNDFLNINNSNVYIGRISPDSYHYFFNNEWDISLPPLPMKSFVNNKIIFDKTYIFSFRGTPRTYYKQFLYEKYNQKPLLRHERLREVIDKRLNNDESDKYNNISFLYILYHSGRNKKGFSDHDYNVKYDFELHNSIFCLIISGDQLYSHRFMEVLTAGCIPIIIDNGYVLPFHNVINWNNYAIIINEGIFFDYTINNVNDFVNYIYYKTDYNNILQVKYDNNISNWFIAIKELYKEYFIDYKSQVKYLIQSMFKNLNKKLTH